MKGVLKYKQKITQSKYDYEKKPPSGLAEAGYLSIIQ